MTGEKIGFDAVIRQFALSCNDSNNRMKNKEACVGYKTQRTKAYAVLEATRADDVVRRLVLVVEACDAGKNLTFKELQGRAATR